MGGTVLGLGKHDSVMQAFHLALSEGNVLEANRKRRARDTGGDCRVHSFPGRLRGRVFRVAARLLVRSGGAKTGRPAVDRGNSGIHLSGRRHYHVAPQKDHCPGHSAIRGDSDYSRNHSFRDTRMNAAESLEKGSYEESSDWNCAKHYRKRRIHPRPSAPPATEAKPRV